MVVISETSQVDRSLERIIVDFRPEDVSAWFRQPDQVLFDGAHQWVERLLSESDESQYLGRRDLYCFLRLAFLKPEGTITGSSNTRAESARR